MRLWEGSYASLSPLPKLYTDDSFPLCNQFRTTPSSYVFYDCWGLLCFAPGTTSGRKEGGSRTTRRGILETGRFPQAGEARAGGHTPGTGVSTRAVSSLQRGPRELAILGQNLPLLCFISFPGLPFWLVCGAVAPRTDQRLRCVCLMANSSAVSLAFPGAALGSSVLPEKNDEGLPVLPFRKQRTVQAFSGQREVVWRKMTKLENIHRAGGPMNGRSARQMT